MKTLSKIFALLMLALAGAASFTGCIEDGFTNSPSDQPAFSTDTLKMGVIFTDEPSPTSRFTVHNPHGKSLSISDISLSGEYASCFRINVDGISGERFSDVEIRGKDSIYVFVEATLPPNIQTKPLEINADINFTTNGVTQTVTLSAFGQNVERLRALTLTADTRLTADIPYQIFDSLVVAPGATLTLEPGTTLCFHDKAMLIVRGRLIAEGTPEAPVTMAGDRTGNVVSDISFDIMSRQWTGVFFTSTSTGNRLSHTNIRNTVQGVAVNGEIPSSDAAQARTSGAGEPQLYLYNCRLRNSGGLVLEAVHSSVKAVGCEFAEAAGGLVYLHGGSHIFNHCTFANYYLFAALSGPAVSFAHISADEKTGSDDGSGLPYLTADFSNCIIYGNGSDISHGDLTGTGVFLRRCLLKSEGEDDDNFQMCIWGEDPLYYTIREEYIFDYRLKPESPAIGAADPTLTLPEASADAYGLSRGAYPDLGAYVYTAPAEEDQE